VIAASRPDPLVSRPVKVEHDDPGAVPPKTAGLEGGECSLWHHAHPACVSPTLCARFVARTNETRARGHAAAGSGTNPRVDGRIADRVRARIPELVGGARPRLEAPSHV